MNKIARTMLRALWAVAVCGVIAFHAQAATVYDEAVHGDLSNDHMNPTSISLGVGQNLISGSTVHIPSLDRDFFTITIGPGQTLTAIVLSSYTNTDDQSFFGMTTGSAFTGLGFSDLSSWALIGAQPGLLIGDNLLTFLTGGPLGPGAHSFWLQETDGSTTYTLDYQVAAVPLPVALPLFLSGLVAMGAMARRATSGS